MLWGKWPGPPRVCLCVWSGPKANPQQEREDEVAQVSGRSLYGLASDLQCGVMSLAAAWDSRSLGLRYTKLLSTGQVPLNQFLKHSRPQWLWL